jgi:hypothetical protein
VSIPIWASLPARVVPVAHYWTKGEAGGRFRLCDGDVWPDDRESADVSEPREPFCRDCTAIYGDDLTEGRQMMQSQSEDFPNLDVSE